jgi:glutathione S-transferase
MSRSPSMRLYWSSRSPFVRKAMVAAHETGAISDLETIRVEVAAAKLSAEVMARNPLNKIPTLLLASGEALFDSHVICEYFDSLHSGPKLFAEPGAARWTALRREAVGNGIMENGVARVGEGFRPKEIQSQPHLAAFKTKITSALDYLEADAPALAATPFNIGHLTIGCALSYLDFRFAADDWRAARPRLAAWHGTFEQRPSVRQTAHADVY